MHRAALLLCAESMSDVPEHFRDLGGLASSNDVNAPERSTLWRAAMN
jgi:hypothetical protein